MSSSDVIARSLLAQHALASDARCPKCAYSLEGLSSDECPECGAKLVLVISSPGMQTSGVSVRFVLWWCFSLQVVCIASTAWAAWSAYEPVLEMTRQLGQPAPSFLKFFWDVSTTSPFDDGGSLAIGVAAAVALGCRHHAMAQGRSARWAPRVAVVLLLATLLHVVVVAVA